MNLTSREWLEYRYKKVDERFLVLVKVKLFLIVISVISATDMGQEHQTQNVFVFSREKTKVPDGPEYLTVSKLEIDKMRVPESRNYHS